MEPNLSESPIEILTNKSRDEVCELSSKKYILLYDDETNIYTNDIEKLVHSAKKYTNFEVIIYKKSEIDTIFSQKNKTILSQTRGGGYWLWKPYIINKTLEKIEPNSYLFYLDSKYYFTDYIDNFIKYIEIQYILLWKNKPNEDFYKLRCWCKMDVFEKYINYENNKDIEICWAGAMIMKNTSNTKYLMCDWLEMCCDINNITDIPSKVKNANDYNEHRHDQSLLSIASHKYMIKYHYFEKTFLQNVRSPW